MLTPSPETAPPAVVADPYFSLTDIPRRAQATKNLASRHFQQFMFSTCGFLYTATVDKFSAAILLNRFSSFMLSMTDRHLFAATLSADLQTTPPHHPTTATIYTDPPTTHHGHFLPNNPMPYMAPSVTHQPELLLLNWMLCTIATLIDDLQHHPIVQDPIPPMSSFINTPAYRLFLQLRNTLRHLINTTQEAQRGLNRLQFIPGSPGSPGHYRMDPTVSITPGQTHYLSDTIHHQPPQPSHHPQTQHLSSVNSVAGIDPAPANASLLPHLHIRTSPHIHGNPPPTLPQLLMAIVGTSTEHSGRLLLRQLPTAWLLDLHHLSPDEARAELRLTSHILPQIKKHTHPCDMSL